MRKSRSPKKHPKAKKVAYQLIDRQQPPYKLLSQLVELYHQELRDARIGLAWCTSWNPDVDGRLTLGKCKKASDLDRELADFDFIVLLNKTFWFGLSVTDKQRSALLDHELCHASVSHDRTGEPARDERDRIIYRTRRHDLEEFAEIAARHGCWKKDLEEFARAIDRARHETADRWVGYAAVREELVAAGVDVALERVREWTEVERRDAFAWALLHRRFPQVSAAMPPHVEAAITISAPAAESLAAHP